MAQGVTQGLTQGVTQGYQRLPEQEEITSGVADGTVSLSGMGAVEGGAKPLIGSSSVGSCGQGGTSAATMTAAADGYTVTAAADGYTEPSPRLLHGAADQVQRTTYLLTYLLT